MNRQYEFLLFASCFLLSMYASAQIQTSNSDSTRMIKKIELLYYQHQKDLIDIGMTIFHRDPEQRLNNLEKLNSKLKVFRWTHNRIYPINWLYWGDSGKRLFFNQF